MTTAQIVQFLTLLLEVLAIESPAKLLDCLFIIFKPIITISNMENNVLVNFRILNLFHALSQLLFFLMEDIQCLFKLSIIIQIQATIQIDVVFIKLHKELTAMIELTACLRQAARVS